MADADAADDDGDGYSKNARLFNICRFEFYSIQDYFNRFVVIFHNKKNY